MPTNRKIERKPSGYRNYFLIDANFLANKHIPPAIVPDPKERARVEACHHWWAEIDTQLRHHHARVYVPDICIAESFKVLAKKYYSDKWFKTPVAFAQARKRLSEDIRTDARTLRRYHRAIKYHDISTNRDIIISVDRFFELFTKHKKKVQIADLILIASGKYLMEFYDIPKESLHIVTLDRPLREGIAKASDLPNAYDPTLVGHRADVVFV